MSSSFEKDGTIKEWKVKNQTEENTSIIIDDEMAEEIKIISDHIKKAGHIYAFCNKSFTL